MPNKNPEQEGVTDYSNYFKKDQPPAPKEVKPTSPLQEIHYSPKFTKRAKYLILILIALVATQIFLFLSWNHNAVSTVPNGYRVVSPPNQPVYLEKIK